jgi:predicted ArsR family transcriptional regulator
MSDEAGKSLQLHEAKDLIRAKLNEKPRLEYVIEADQEKILVSLSERRASAEDLSRLLGVHPERMEHVLGELERNRYVYAMRLSGLGLGIPTKYQLTDRGRGYLISKDKI